MVRKAAGLKVAYAPVVPLRGTEQPSDLPSGWTYGAEAPGQDAELVDGVDGDHDHGGDGQTPAQHVGPHGERVGAVFRGVEGREAHHHHELGTGREREKGL